MSGVLRITSARHVGAHRLALCFNDGTNKVVDVAPLLEGPVFEPLHNEEYFSCGAVDPLCGTVVWPNGADFAPEALKALEAATEDAT